MYVADVIAELIIKPSTAVQDLVQVYMRPYLRTLLWICSYGRMFLDFDFGT